MSDQIGWYVELAVKSGALADFEKLTSEMVAATRAEDGVLAYQRFISDDRQTIVVYERYLNSAAAIAHLQAFAVAFGECYDRMVERKRFVVLGRPSEGLRALLDRYGANYLDPFGSLAYWPD